MALNAVRTMVTDLAVLAAWTAGDAGASHVVHLPIFAAVQAETGSGFNVTVMGWDQEGAPSPLRLHGVTAGYRFAGPD
jgi:hypothetical protein